MEFCIHRSSVDELASFERLFWQLGQALVAVAVVEKSPL